MVKANYRTSLKANLTKNLRNMKIFEKRLRKIIFEKFDNVCGKYEEDFKTWEKSEWNFKEIIVKYEKNLKFFRKL